MKNETASFLIRRTDGKFYSINDDMDTVWLGTDQGALNYLEKEDAEAVAVWLIETGHAVVVHVVKAEL